MRTYPRAGAFLFSAICYTDKMEKEICIQDKKIIYQIKKSRRSRHIRLTVRRDASVTLTIPWGISEKEGEKFLAKKSDWLLHKINYFENKNPASLPSASRKDYKKYKGLARRIVEDKLAYFGPFYDLSAKRVFIRNPKTRWGSCSQRGNLNFSYRIIYLSEKLCDYIIVHELCHLKELNHSQRFWDLVAKAVPDYKKIRKKIRVQ